MWCSEGHVLLGLAREFFLCVLQSQCSVKARVFEHFWLFSIDVVWFHTLSNKMVILLKCRRRVTAVGTAVW